MNANASRTVMRLTSAVAAAAVSLGLVSTISQQMDVRRIGLGAPQRVLLESVTVLAPATVAATNPATRLR